MAEPPLPGSGMFRLAAPGAILAGGAGTALAGTAAGLLALRAGATAFRAGGFPEGTPFLFAAGFAVVLGLVFFFFFFAALGIPLLSLL